RRDRGSQTREQIRGELGVHDDERLVLVTGGGGEDGYQLLANYVHGLSHIPRGTKIKTLLICGPEMSEQDRRRIRLAAAHPGLVRSSTRTTVSRKRPTEWIWTECHAS